MTDAEMMEKLAHVEHERWSHWMKYLFTKGTMQPDGSFRIAPESVAHWGRQMETPYARLTEKEKESDRVEVRKTLAVLAERSPAAHLLQTSKERDRAVVERQEHLWKLQDAQAVIKEAHERFDALKADYDKVQAWACEVITAVQASVKADVIPALASMQAKNMALETQLLIAREKWDSTFPNDGIKRSVLPYRELDALRHGADMLQKKMRELSFTALAVVVTDPASKEHKDAINGLEFELHQAGYM